MVNSYIPKQKDIVLLNFTPAKGHEQKGYRPAIVISNEVLEFWSDKKLEGPARTFWRYNTKRAWSDIHNWKRAAIGWSKKAKDNMATFKANKTKHTKPYTMDYESVLPDLSYNSWDIL